MSRAFVIHGWGGGPDKDWMPWMVKTLTDKGYDVVAPQMPDTNVPVIDAWINKLSKLVGDLRPDDVFIGHSIGCQTILRFLEKLPEGQKVNKVILVAPWVELTNLENEEAWKIADPWIKSQMDFSKIINKSNSFITIFSDNDSWVPIEVNKKYFEEKLNPQILVLPQRGHFTQDEGILEIPEIVKFL